MCIAITAWRLTFGVDFMDEAFNLAVPYRFVLGDKPYIDEANPTQSATFLTVPFLWAFHTITGGTEGVVLFARLVWFALTGLLAFLVFKSLRPIAGGVLATLVALTVVIWLPLGSPTLSYNTYASGFFTLGVFVGVAPHFLPRGERWFFYAGLAHGATVLAIQSYGLAVLAFTLCAVVGLSPREKRVRRALLHLGGVCVAPLLCLPYLLDVGEPTMEFAREYLRRRGDTLVRAWGVVTQYAQAIERAPWIALALGTLVVSVRWRKSISPFVALIALGSLPLLTWQARQHQSSLLHVALAALYAPFLAALVWKHAWVRPLFVGVWIPSFVAALVAAFTSGNGVINAGFGMLPGMLVTMLFAAILTRDIAEQSKHSWIAKLDLVFAVLFALCLVTYQRKTYNDDDTLTLDARFTHGIYAGLCTSAEKKAWFETLERDVLSFRDPRARICFFPRFPAGYLMTDMRPATHSVWAVFCPPTEDPENCADAIAANFEHYGAQGIVVFRLRRAMYGRSRFRTSMIGSVDPLLDRDFERALVTPDYTVYVKH